MVCFKCSETIDRSVYNSVKYCSYRCQKLYLKSQYKKRTADKQLAYQREYRKAKYGGDTPPANPARYRQGTCLKCGTDKDLQACHVKPLWAGGTHDHIITLCRKHHHRFDVLLHDFWGSSLPPVKQELTQADYESVIPKEWFN